MTGNEFTGTPRAPSPFFYVVPLLIVLAVGAVFFMGGKEANEDKDVPLRKVEVGKDYYMLITLMEFHPKKVSGANWDGGNSAPDIFYHLQWHDKSIFNTENDVEEDVLIGAWRGLAGDLKLSTLGELFTPDGIRVNLIDGIKAAHISVESNGELVVLAYDKDALRDDKAGRCVLRTADLKLGDNEYFIDANGHATCDRDDLAKDRGGLKRLVLRVVDSTQPIEELIKALR